MLSLLIHWTAADIKLCFLLIESNFYKAFSTKVAITSESTFTHYFFILFGGITESQFEVERDLWRSSCPNPLLKQGDPEPIVEEHVQMAFENLQRGRLHNLSGQKKVDVLKLLVKISLGDFLVISLKKIFHLVFFT